MACATTRSGEYCHVGQGHLSNFDGDDVRTLMTLGGAQAQAGGKDRKTFDQALAIAPDGMKPMIQQQVVHILKP